MRTLYPALCLLMMSGCGPAPDQPGPGAIEITGYLDVAKVSWSTHGDDVIASGTEEAASWGSTAIEVEILH